MTLRLFGLTLVLSLAAIVIVAFANGSTSSAQDCAPEAMNTISGEVFLDANANGVLDEGEAGTEGVTLVLSSDSDGDARPGQGDQALDSQTTDWYGNYGFQWCASGTFLVQPDAHSLPHHEVLSTKSFVAVSFDAVGQARGGNNFGHSKRKLVENQVIVGFVDGTSPERIQEIIYDHGIVPLWEVPGINAWVVATSDVDKQIEKFLALPEVKWAEPNYIGGVAPDAPVAVQETPADLAAKEAPADLAAPAAEPDAVSLFPDDPDYNDPVKGYGPRQVNAPAAWDTTTGSAGVIVAVVDSGVSPVHTELSAALLPGKDFVNNDLDASDDNGHGTHVAGIIAAAINNGQGLAGVAAGIRILPVKVLNSANLGDYATFAAGINYAVQNGARIINLSLGGPSDSQALHDAVQAAANQGVLVVVASGNTADTRDYYPASYPEALSVAGTTTAGEWWNSSTFNNQVDLAAPAQQVWSTYWSPTDSGAYAFQSGTSMAAPFVSAAAALLLSTRPDLQSGDLRTILQQSAHDLGPTGVDAYTGYGLLDTGAAMNAGGAWTSPTSTPPPTLTPTATPLPYLQRLNAAGALYTDSAAQIWAKDKAFVTGSWGYVGGSAKSNSTAVNGTTDDLLYQKYREGMTEYRFTVPNGTYQVTLKFAEFGTTTVGDRVIRITIEGTDVETSLDVYRQVGKATALDKAYATTVNDGILNIAFAKVSGRKSPMVSAVEVVMTAPEATATPTLTPAPTRTPGGPTDTPTATPTPTYTPTPTATPLPYAQRVNAGGTLFTDSVAQSWAADQAFATGSWGYLSGSAKSSSTAVNGTTDVLLYQKYREAMTEYRFTVPNGIYQITLKFAEFGTTTVGDRVMNISIEGSAVETALDVYAQVGKAAALDKTYLATVNDGVLNIVFARVGGRKPPMVSAIGVIAP